MSRRLAILANRYGLILGLWSALSLMGGLGAIAAPAQAGFQFNKEGDFTEPPSPDDKPGATRPNPCRPGELGMTPIALSSGNSENPGDYWGYTEQAQPTLWVYIPHAGRDIAQFKVSLRNEANEIVYEAPLSLPETAGILAVPLTDAPALQPGQWYRWYVFARVYCSDDIGERPYLDRAQGRVQRRSPDPAMTTDDWIYDRLQNAATDSATWRALLQTLGQAEIADRPRLDCCQPQP
ncbi:MAG: DUF928 domain-containing protein [Spirulinaceae cyanobacterium RM2_2_10]|nr:DUF928 domain-containing protein [Spirulinaceae cyanobacterium SM2_1_0]NJO19216.1 DUF928 domain-containing protein [Spirulinaceae cyanobacterium RM2_2_10]